MKALNRSHQSAYVIRAGILEFFRRKKLFPTGLREDMECVQDWGLKMGQAVARLAAGLLKVDVWVFFRRYLPLRVALDHLVHYDCAAHILTSKLNPKPSILHHNH